MVSIKFGVKIRVRSRVKVDQVQGKYKDDGQTERLE